MAKMKLYYSPGSPYARKVRIVAMETKLDKKMEMVNVAVGATLDDSVYALMLRKQKQRQEESYSPTNHHEPK